MNRTSVQDKIAVKKEVKFTPPGQSFFVVHDPDADNDIGAVFVTITTGDGYDDDNIFLDRTESEYLRTILNEILG